MADLSGYKALAERIKSLFDKHEEAKDASPSSDAKAPDQAKSADAKAAPPDDSRQTPPQDKKEAPQQEPEPQAQPQQEPTQSAAAQIPLPDTSVKPVQLADSSQNPIAVPYQISNPQAPQPQPQPQPQGAPGPAPQIPAGAPGPGPGAPGPGAPAAPDAGVPPMLAAAPNAVPPAIARAGAPGQPAAPVDPAKVPQDAQPPPDSGQSPYITEDDLLGQNQANQASNAQDRQAYARDVLNAADAQNADMKAVADKSSVANQAFQKSLDASSQRMQAAMAQYNTAAKQIEMHREEAIQKQANFANSMPKDFWGAAGVNKVAGMIGLILGGIGTIGGGRNTAFDMLNHLVESNMQRQKMQYDMLGSQVENYNNTYAHLREKLGSTIQAENAFRQVSLLSYKNQLEQVLNRTVNPRAKANLAQAITGLNQNLMALKSQSQANTMKYLDSAMKTSLERYKFNSALSAKAAEPIPGLDGFVQTNPSYAPSASKLDEIRERAGGVQEINAIIKRMLPLLSKGRKNLNMQHLDQLQADLKSALRRAAGLSTRVQGGEGQLLEQMAGRFEQGWMGILHSNISPEDYAKNLRKSNRDLHLTFAASISPFGFKPVTGGSYHKDDYGEEDDKGSNAISKFPVHQSNAPVQTKVNQPIAGSVGY